MMVAISTGLLEARQVEVSEASAVSYASWLLEIGALL